MWKCILVTLGLELAWLVLHQGLDIAVARGLVGWIAYGGIFWVPLVGLVEVI